MDVTGRAPDASSAPVSVSEPRPLCAPESRKWVLLSAILASALGFIDGTITAIALPAMRESLGATLPQAQWIDNAYILTLSAPVLAGGAMGDRFGVAHIFMSGIALFVAASVVCALAPDSPSSPAPVRRKASARPSWRRGRWRSSRAPIRPPKEVARSASGRPPRLSPPRSGPFWGAFSSPGVGAKLGAISSPSISPWAGSRFGFSP